MIDGWPSYWLKSNRKLWLGAVTFLFWAPIHTPLFWRGRLIDNAHKICSLARDFASAKAPI